MNGLDEFVFISSLIRTTDSLEMLPTTCRSFMLLQEQVLLPKRYTGVGYLYNPSPRDQYKHFDFVNCNLYIDGILFFVPLSPKR